MHAILQCTAQKSSYGKGNKVKCLIIFMEITNKKKIKTAKTKTVEWQQKKRLKHFNLSTIPWGTQMFLLSKKALWVNKY